MQTIRKEQHICQFCNKDFTKESYATRINHSNNCDWNNTMISVRSFYNAKSEEDRLFEFFDMIGLDCCNDYNEIIDIYNCVLGMITNGHIEIDQVENTKDFIEITQFFIDNKNKIAFKYNNNIIDEIYDINTEAENKIKQLEKKLVK